MAGPVAACTVMRQASVAVLPEMLVARDRHRVGAAVPAAGVPAMVAVPLVLSVKVSPLGRVPDSVMVAAG